MSELTTVKQWMIYHNISGRKIPYSVQNQRSGSTYTHDYVTYAEAIEAATRFNAGLAFCFTRCDPYIGVDIDDCFAPDGTLKDWAAPIVQSLHNTYMEISPSRTGIKAYGQGNIPASTPKVYKIGDGQVEIYSERRFFAFTGWQCGKSTEITDVQDAINRITDTYRTKPQECQPSSVAANTSALILPTASIGDITLQHRISSYIAKCGHATEGGRNNLAFRIAGHLFSMRDQYSNAPPYELIFREMTAWNANNSPPLPDSELAQVIKSSLKNGTPRSEKTHVDQNLELSPELHAIVEQLGTNFDVGPSLNSENSIAPTPFRILTRSSLDLLSRKELQEWGDMIYRQNLELTSEQQQFFDLITGLVDMPPTEVDGADVNGAEQQIFGIRRVIEFAVMHFTIRPPDLLALCCIAVQQDLDEEHAIATITAIARHRCNKSSPTKDEITHTLKAAEEIVVRGKSSYRRIPAPGHRDIITGQLVLSTERTKPTAQAFVREFFTIDNQLILYYVDRQFFTWNRDANCYQELKEGELRRKFQSWLHEACVVTPPKASRKRKPNPVEMLDKDENPLLLNPFPANSRTIASAVDALRDLVIRSHTAPTWLTTQSTCDPRRFIAFPGGLLHLSDLKVFPPTPLFYTLNALSYPYQPTAREPDCWHDFLQKVFQRDAESIATLQEFFGYSLIPDNKFQKMLCIWGPPRSGKGTIGKQLAHMIGFENTVFPTMSGLANEFGIWPLDGKLLAVISDARFRGRDIQIALERLLTISGGDPITYNRKCLNMVTKLLYTRFMFLTNELPDFNDMSGAIATRFLVLRTRESYLGHEDIDLSEKIRSESPGILNWALKGLERLFRNGRFTEPQSSKLDVQEMQILANPVREFVANCCVLGEGHRVDCQTLYDAFDAWRSLSAIDPIDNRVFGKYLKSIATDVKRRDGTGHVAFYDQIGLKN
ncbi:MAG: phage/plasmid primase, P4 family [Planctomycetota bacterium]|nr:phage/plasmid primase, P4 family [Planctomycetota bacterium]